MSLPSSSLLILSFNFNQLLLISVMLVIAWKNLDFWRMVHYSESYELRTSSYCNYQFYFGFQEFMRFRFLWSLVKYVLWQTFIETVIWIFLWFACFVYILCSYALSLSVILFNIWQSTLIFQHLKDGSLWA